MLDIVQTVHYNSCTISTFSEIYKEGNRMRKEKLIKVKLTKSEARLIADLLDKRAADIAENIVKPDCWDKTALKTADIKFAQIRQLA